MKARAVVLSALVLLGISALVVRLGKPSEEQSLQSVAALWGDLFWDTGRVASAPMHVSAAEEARLGHELARTVMSYNRLDAATHASVTQVGVRLARGAPGRTGYVFTGLDSPEINAFSLPGGQVFVMKGLAGFVKSDDELAAVIGHEMAHIELRHCLDGYRYSAVMKRIGLADAGEMMDLLRRDLSITYSREQEFEADARGVVIASQSGYDATAAIRVFRRLALQEGPRGSGMLRPYFESHPGAEERAQRLERQLGIR